MMVLLFIHQTSANPFMIIFYPQYQSSSMQAVPSQALPFSLLQRAFFIYKALKSECKAQY